MKTRILSFLVLLFVASQAFGHGAFYESVFKKDTIKISKDSLMRIIHMKDSLLLQASLDSLAITNMLEAVWFEKDSIEDDLRDLRFKLHLDSIYRVKRDSLWTEWNREHRWELRDSLYGIDSDSVRFKLERLLDIVYSDSSRIPRDLGARDSWDQLFYHLKNDSTFFTIYHAEDSIQFVLKDGAQFKEAIFITNTLKDSAKIFVRGKDQYNLSLWMDDDVFLKEMLKIKDLPEELPIGIQQLNGLKIKRKSMPPAPPKYWHSNGSVVFQLNQVANSNWVKGGDNRFTFLLDTKGEANYAKGKLVWQNNYWYRYGLLKSEGQDLFKNIDALRVKSNLTHKAFKKFNYSALGQFDTQLFPGYRSPSDSVPVSKFMSPAFLNIGGGMKYEPDKYLDVNFSPVSGKFTFVLDTITVSPKKFGLEPGKRVKGEPGATLNVNYKRLLWKNINLDTKLRLFSAYMKNPEKIDVDWTTQFSLKVNKYVSTTLFFHLIYDDDIIIPFYEWVDGVKTKVDEGKAVQLQETFGVTFTYHL